METTKKSKDNFGSFRDPSGFIYKKNGKLYRQINTVYQPVFDALEKENVFEDLIKKGMLIPHNVASKDLAYSEEFYKIVQPEEIPFVSYPYEWSFSQLKDAALLTLDIALFALERGFILKDAPAYNIQFYKGRPILVDTLSLDFYEEGSPWVAYKQFCEHFLAPLALMSYVDGRLHRLSRLYVEGIPLDLVSKLLPAKVLASLGLLMHIKVHAKSQVAFSEKSLDENKKKSMRKDGVKAILLSLRNTVSKLHLHNEKTEWGDYYSETNYDDVAFQQKKTLVKEYINKANPNSLWDLGANTGVFSDISSSAGIFTVSADIDYMAVERNYLRVRRNKEANILPLIVDLVNPSPSIGWANTERDSFYRRGPADMVLALALIHHLAIGNNVPFELQANLFKNICKWLVIEFIPKEDSNVQRLLSTREDVFTKYNQESFEEAFSKEFKIVNKKDIKHSKRVLYLMSAK